MSRREALTTLGLDEGADADAIRAAHRRLMKKVHPDQGGSAALAARVQAARDTLLG
jgi:curved DNA-binding protein CbpA